MRSLSLSGFSSGSLSPQPGRPKIKTLCLDIETSPNLAYVWGLFNQNISLNQLVDSTEVICFAAKWLDKRGITFRSHRDDDMIETVHDLLSEADVVMHYNGRKFDIPHLNREFVLAGLTPPAPYEQIDLWEVVKRRFRFPSTKLEYVSKKLGLAGKVQHEGFELWVKCMAGDPAAWKRMEKYNKQDVVLLEDLYHILQPWIPNHPTRTLYDGGSQCPTCESGNITKQGYARTKVSTYQRWKCENCGSWFRSGHRVGSVSVRQTAL